MTQSEQLFEKSEHFLPGGVNSPVRAFRNVGGTPVFVKSGKGSHMLDEDGNERHPCGERIYRQRLHCKI